MMSSAIQRPRGPELNLTILNAILFHIDPIRIEAGGIRIENGVIVESGPGVEGQPHDASLDAGGAVVLPGLVNGHTHLYSALASGMLMPERTPKNFHEILKFIWWRLDRALDAESIEMSARIGAMDALACGTTTLIDHHASPACIGNSLDLIERSLLEVGLRGVLCYETTDRNGPGGFEMGLAENRRYLDKLRMAGANGRFGALVGAHAAFTLSDASLRACVELASEYGAGVHIHVAEDPCDDAICRDQYATPLMDRLRNAGLLEPEVAQRSIFGHGTHLSATDARMLSSISSGIAHNTRSNMNNAVGYAPIEHMSRVLLGTDGIGGDMFNESKTAWFKYRDARRTGGVTPGRILEMLAANARVASHALGVTVGKLEAGAAGDVVVTNYVPATPITTENAAGHFVFSMGPQHVTQAIVGGVARFIEGMTSSQWSGGRQASRDVAAAMWNRMARIPV